MNAKLKLQVFLKCTNNTSNIYEKVLCFGNNRHDKQRKFSVTFNLFSFLQLEIFCFVKLLPQEDTIMTIKVSQTCDIATDDGRRDLPLGCRLCVFFNLSHSIETQVLIIVLTSGVARTAPMLGHSMGTLRLYELPCKSGGIPPPKKI